VTAPVPHNQTRRRVPMSAVGDINSDQLPSPDGIIGHARAIGALTLGLSIRSPGYHTFAMGRPNVGIQSMVHTTVESVAARRNPAPDTVLLHNFKDLRQPFAVRLPTGTGPGFQRAMEDAIEKASRSVPAAFAHDAYQVAKRAVVGREQARSASLFHEFQQAARSMGVAVHRKEDTLIVAPMDGETLLDAAAFEALPEEKKAPLQQAMERVQQQMTTLASQERERMQEIAEVTANLDIRTAASGTRPLFNALKDAWPQPELQSWFSQAESALVREGPGVYGEDLTPWTVNVMVTNSLEGGAPVIDVDEPAWPALAGRVEHMPIDGALSTNHTLVRPGALHAAHGGFLIIEARRLLSHAGAWMGLKRALRQVLIRTEAPTPEAGVVNAVTLEPEPMSLDVDVVLVGTHSEYRTLTANDPDFVLLFGVAAEFESDMPWTDGNVGLLASRLADLGRRDELQPLTPAAMAALVEHAGRMAENQSRLSLAIEPLRRIHREADFLATTDDDEFVSHTHIQRAVDAQRHREGGSADRNRRGYLDGSIRVRTDGSSIGEVNGLAVLSTGRMRFGMASRISARAWPGRGAIINIEGESGLSGSFHDKGILVLTGLLGGRYANNVPLCVTATLVFEQSYTPVDGDSASMAETVALLSALSGVPVLQGRAITGSIDQNGGAQAIGGVNDKVEGFFDLCSARTLTGQQGVVIPRANVSDLMLRNEVVQAIQDGHFHVWPMDTIDDAFEMLTGVPAGGLDDDGGFLPGTPNAAVKKRLADFAGIMRYQLGG
jgi:lon-related putative ATP-dependent protease